jgi:hypothetical protein
MRTFIFSASILVMVVVVGCGRTAPAPATSEAGQVPVATVKDLMLSIIDTSADVVWQSVSAVSNEQGTTETRPQTDEEWARVRYGALALAESANLLLVPGRRVARPGELSEVPGIELEPEEMDALITKDPAAFYEHAVSLRNAALEVVSAVDKKDADKVFEIGEHIERACEGCHTRFWYPNEKIPPVKIGTDTGTATGTATGNEPAAKN